MVALTSKVSAETPCGDPKVRALQVVDAYMETFNARDAPGHVATLHYPSFRINALGELLVLQSASEYEEMFSRQGGHFPWDHTLYDSREVLQAGARKVHVAVAFSRYGKGGEKLSSHDSLYILTCRDGRWGIVARSSFVPVIRPLADLPPDSGRRPASRGPRGVTLPKGESSVQPDRFAALPPAIRPE